MTPRAPDKFAVAAAYSAHDMHRLSADELRALAQRQSEMAEAGDTIAAIVVSACVREAARRGVGLEPSRNRRFLR